MIIEGDWKIPKSIMVTTMWTPKIVKLVYKPHLDISIFHKKKLGLVINQLTYRLGTPQGNWNSILVNLMKNDSNC